MKTLLSFDERKIFSRLRFSFPLKGLQLFVVLSMILIMSSVGRSVTVEEDPYESQLREIAKTLRCAVCQSESVWESNAGLAKQMRVIIRERLEQGQSPDEIRAYFQSRYGDFILLEPTKSGMNWVLWVGPFVLLAIGGLILYRTVVRWTKKTASTEPEDVPGINAQDRERIDRELHKFDE